MNISNKECDTEAKIIRSLRGEMSQEFFAEKCGLQTGQISKLENGKQSPTAKTVRKIADAHNMTMSDFYALDRKMHIAKEISPERKAIDKYLDSLSEKNLIIILGMVKILHNLDKK